MLRKDPGATDRAGGLSAEGLERAHQTMTEETNVIHALRWWRRLRRLAESRLDPAIARRSAAAAARPARCAGDLAAVAERLARRMARGRHRVRSQADLRILSVALLAFSDQLAAEDREQGGGTAWAGEATAAATPWPPATSLTCHQVGTRPGG